MTSDENTVFIGGKPPMNYVLAIVTQFNGGADEVLLKARGRAISRAVDVAEIVRNRFVEEAKVKDIRIGTERVSDARGKSSNVSSIEILLHKAATARTDDSPPLKDAPQEEPATETPLEVAA